MSNNDYTPEPPEPCPKLQASPHYWLYKVTREALDNKNHPLHDLGHIWNRRACEGLSEEDKEENRINNTRKGLYSELNNIEKEIIIRFIRNILKQSNWNFENLNTYINFSNAVWENEINFEDFIFFRPISFRKSVFKQKSKFYSTIFAYDVDCISIQFLKNTDFSKAIFNKDIYFSDGLFNDGCNFKSARFVKDVGFSSAVFCNIVIFWHAVFWGNIIRFHK